MRKTTLLGLGAVLLIIISIFLPIVKTAVKSGLLFDGSREGKELGYVILVIVAIMGLFAFLANKRHLASIGTLIFAGLLCAIGGVFYSVINEEGGTMGMGLVLFLVGSILGIVSAVLGFMKK
jgi:hypothetical protein